jgi:hypothetical protein
VRDEATLNVFFHQIVGKDGDVPVRKIEWEDAMTVIDISTCIPSFGRD